MVIISLKNIVKDYRLDKYEFVRVLNNINLDVYDGEFLVIMGPSGSGKSTITNLLAGLDKPTQGEIKYLNTDLTNAKAKVLAIYRQKVVGMVFQSFNLISRLSVWDNIKLARLISKYNKKDTDKDIASLLKSFQMEDRRKYVPTKLSGGQQQRAAIARALINNPQIILADEPTGNLDSANGEIIIQTLKALNEREGKTVIVVTHNEEIAKLADRVVYMKDGAIEKIDVKSEPKLGSNDSSNVIDITKVKAGKIGFFSSVKLALSNIRKSKVRTALTAFGIAIGITSIVLLTSFATILQQIAIDQIKGNSSLKDISVMTKYDTSPGGGLFGGSVSTSTSVESVSPTPMTQKQLDAALTNQTIDKIKKVPNVEDAYYAGISANNTKITYKKKTTTDGYINLAYPVKYASKDPSIQYTNLSVGKRFSSDTENSVIVSSVMKRVLGINSVNELLGISFDLDMEISSVDPTVTPLKIKKTLKIIGVYDDEEQYGSTAPNTSVNIPINLTIPYGLLDFGKTYINISTIEVITNDENNVKGVQSEIDKMGFQTQSTQSIIEQINQSFLVLKLILASIGGISLAVSCLAIVNIMLISVLERFKEIGIMKAIGARPSDIRRLFIAESAVIGFLGGAIGVLGGYLIGKGIMFFINSMYATEIYGENSMVPHLDFYIPWHIVGIAFLIALVVSMLGAMYPAFKASRLNPIDALRRE